MTGTTNTVEEAWCKATKDLRVRLVLAESNTNTAQQRTQITAAIIIPKLLYVARHAWPTPDIVKHAELCIRNYVWNSIFSVADRASAGWMQAALAEQRGIELPNLQTELMAMSAVVVGEWALAVGAQRHAIGDILQRSELGQSTHLVPQRQVPTKETKETLWGTGRPWAEWYFGTAQQPKDESAERIRRMRQQFRLSNGVKTTWNRDGLTIQCN
jgi:hypothetical protein